MQLVRSIYFATAGNRVEAEESIVKKIKELSTEENCKINFNLFRITSKLEHLYAIVNYFLFYDQNVERIPCKLKL